MKFAAFGRTHWLDDSIRSAVAAGHEAVLIGTCAATPEYRVTEKHFSQLAEELGCPFFCDSSINRPEYIRLAAESGAEVAISVNWLTIIGQRMIDVFRHGVINAHAGDLPRFRGNACPNWAILSSEAQVVLTLHQMAVDLDAGPILLQQAFPLTERTYVADVYRFLERTIPDLFVEALHGLETGAIVPRPQPLDPSLSLRCFPRAPGDGLIDWGLPAEDLARLVRASAEPFSGAYTFRGAEKLVVWRAYASSLPYPHLGSPGQVVSVQRSTGEVAVLTGAGVLVLEELETAHGRSRAAEQITSTRLRLGMQVQDEIYHLHQRIAQMETHIQSLLNEQATTPSDAHQS